MSARHPDEPPPASHAPPTPGAGERRPLDVRPSLLNRRYALPNRPIFKLNAAQREALAAVRRHLETGEYRLEERPCVICGGESFDRLAERDRYSLPVQTLMCRECGLLQTNPVMRERDYVHFYERYYRTIYEGSATPTDAFVDWQIQRSRGIADYVGETRALAGRTVVEIGCGAGGLLDAFREAGATVLGFDFDDEYLEAGRRRGLDLRYGGIDAIPAGTRPDVILYTHVLEHVYDVNRDLARVREVLAEDGVVYVNVPGVYNIESTYFNDLLRYLQNAHLYHFSLTSLTNLFARHGLVRLRGDERIWALFGRGGDGGGPERVSDYPGPLPFLRETERRRPGFTLRRRVKAATAGALESVGLLDLALSLKRTVTGRRRPG